MALSGSEKTGLGLHGIPRRDYGSFAGKASFVPTALELYAGNAYGVRIRNRNGVWVYTQLIFTGEDFGIPD